jgi:hypothetical protein
MRPQLRDYFQGRLEQTAEALVKNNFLAHVAGNVHEAKKLVMETLIPQMQPASISFGGSMSLVDCGIYEAVKALSGVKVLDTYNYSLSPEEMMELRRQALLCDLYLTGTNAVTEQGSLVNLDGQGNRVAAMAYGPKKVIVVVGRNKLCPDEYMAMQRVSDLAAPVNASRLSKKTPCVKTLRCEDCSSPDRICNIWTITRKSWPKERMTVVLVNEDLGF